MFNLSHLDPALTFSEFENEFSAKRNMKEETHFDILPTEMLVEIVKYLDRDSMMVFSCVDERIFEVVAQQMERDRFKYFESNYMDMSRSDFKTFSQNVASICSRTPKNHLVFDGYPHRKLQKMLMAFKN